MQGFDEGYVTHLEARGLSTNSIAAYKRVVKDWLTWLDDREPTRILAEEYLADKGASGMKATTLSHRVTSIRCYYEHLVEAYESCVTNPWKTVRKPKLPPRFPRVLTHEQCMELIAQPMRSWRNGIMVSTTRRATT